MKSIILLAALIVLFSCSKKVHEENEVTPTGLLLDLRQSALQVQEVDSADVVFRKIGTSQTVKEKFVKHAGVLAAPLTSLTPGTWNADVEVYTKAVNLQSNQYKIIKPIVVPDEKAGIELAGPGATSGNGWLKRHVRASAGNEVVVIVPDEVYDSYFEFRTKMAGKYSFGVQREAIKTNHLVARESWACTESCLDTQRHIIDVNHFMPFTQTILSTPWTSNLINASVLNEQGQMILTYDRTWVQ